MTAKKIVIVGGGANLYKVSESSGWFYAYICRGFFGGPTASIGKTRSMKDALDLIRSYSGKEIKEISDW